MNPDSQNTVAKSSPKKIILISVITFVLLMLAVTAQFTYSILSSNKVYNGVYINDISAANKTTNELKDILNSKFQDNVAKYSLSLKTPSKTQKLNYSDVNVVYDVNAAVDKAFAAGRYGNILDRIYDIVKLNFNQAKLEIPVSYSKDKVAASVTELYSNTLIDVKDADLLIQDDKVVMRSGHHGENIDKTKVINDIDSYITQCKEGTIDCEVVKTMPNKIDTDSYYSKISRDVKDAELKVENNNVAIIPEITGRSIDKQELAKIIDEMSKTENTEKILPVIFVKPKITSKDAAENLFKDTLYTFETQFYTATKNDSNRGDNIRIAVSKINGKVLAPGDVFSFNDIVGNRTEADGYKLAHTYVAGKVVDGVGGGICQVSTTLYNSVLFSGLDVLERTNHMFTVGYVPLGRDAAVSFGDVDFKFKNSTSWPIRIEGWVTNGNQIVFSIKGKNENPGRTIDVYSNTAKTLDFKTVYVDDPAVKPGVEDIKTEGMKGFVIDTYKVVKQNGKVVSEGKIYTSTYNALDREIHRAPQVPGNAKPAQKPAAGVDDAANPPAKPS